MKKSCVLIVVMFSFLTLIGCYKKEPLSYIEDSRIKKITLLFLFGDAPVYVTDLEYYKVNENWLPIYYKKYQKQLFKNNVLEWREGFDCDKFSSYYASYAQLYSFGQRWTQNKGLAIGEVFYYKNGDLERGHAINVIVTDKKVIYIEPQTGEQIKLTQEELNSIFFVRF